MTEFLCFNQPKTINYENLYAYESTTSQLPCKDMLRI
jgi:hypothetical protein